MDSNLLEKNVGYGYAFIAALPYLIIHLMCFGVFFIEISPSGFIIFLVSYWIRIFGVGAGYHRLFAHRSFKTSRFFQFFLAILGASALQRGVLWWASTHRVHHCHADTEQDLHSPKHQGFFYSYLGWVLHPREKKTNLDLVPDLKKYTELVWLDKKPVWISISVLYAVGVTLLFGAEGFFWGFCISTVAIWHTVHWIQTFSHTWSGYRRFKTQDDSRNHWLLGIFSLGEYHNNHHFYPYSAKQGVVWWEIDIVYHVLKVLEFFGIVWDIKLPKQFIENITMKNKFEFYTKILNDIGVSVDGEGSCNIRVKDERFFKKALSQGTLGIGEAYVEGWWDCSALDELACRVLKSRVFSKFESLLGKVHAKVRSGINLQTKYKSKEVVDIHYNLGNDFFEKILGTTMIYTCAYWKDSKSLDQAQRNKLELICQKLQLQPSDIVLDIGCGWGGFSKYACENYGCRVVGVNLSEFQVSYAKNFCTNLRADFEVMDYRDRKLRELGPFDKIVSIGMFEHVGPKNYEVFMDIVSQNLKKDGIFVLQTVGSNLRSGNSLWINKYVFPNSVLPLFHEIPKASNSYLVLEDVQNLRSDYDKTLLAWYENLSMIDKLLYDERFFRMWEYYLLTFAGAFRAGDRTQLWQFVFSKSGTNKAYIAPRQ